MHTIAKLTLDINNYFLDGNVIAACLVNLEKAFDTVWLYGLFFKMIRRGFPAHLLKILWHSLRGRKLVIKNGNFKSDIMFDLKEGL